MPQRKQLTWTELRVGLFVMVGLSVLAAGIFYVTGQGILGPKYRLKTYLPEVSWLAKGATVRVDGVEVGNVESITFLRRTPGRAMERNKNIEVVMRVDRKFQGDILTDSIASLRTEGLLGNRYVTISRGITGTPIPDSGVIPGTEEKAMSEVVERSAEVLGNLSALSTDVRELVAGVQEGRGSLGKMLTDDQAYNHLNGLLAKGDAMMTGIRDGQGTLGKLVASDDLYAKVDKGMDDVNVMLADTRAGKGTLGKLLYDHLAGLTGDMRLLIGDFRQNPKKFLHIKITLF